VPGSGFSREASSSRGIYLFSLWREGYDFGNLIIITKGMKMITVRPALSLFLVAGLAFSFAKATQAQAPTLSVDAASGQHAINPNIYGIVNYNLDPTFAQEIKVPNIRWGGDGTTRYNWQVDASNSGFDWYFVGGNGETNPVPSASADLMINTYKPAGALMTIPIIPYVNSTSAWNCSFPTSIYGAQQSTDPYLHPNGEDCGNSLTTAGAQLTDNDILANHIPNSVSLQKGWVQHLVSTFGTAANGGVPFYQLDNEPYGWANTHRDIEPTQPTYSTIVSLGQQYAAAIKEVDPTAMVFGPSDFTFGGWLGNTSEQNNLYAGQYYLQQMAAYNQQTGTRILDYFDEHYYPIFSDPTTQLASTRTLWDPTYNSGTWIELYDFDGPMQLIPRFRQWISQYYPGTKLSFSEYSIDSQNKLITDALAEADVLGIFGQQSVDFANMWYPPAPTDPIAYSFRLFRNYDGAGGQFGSNGVSAVSSNPGNLSIYAAVRPTDGALTIVVINKTTAAIATPISLANYASTGTAEVYSYSNANLTQITAQGTTPIASNSISYTFPAYSATVFVAEKGAQTAVLTSPSPSSVLGFSTTFTWSAGTGVSHYGLWLGTTSGSSNLYNSGSITATSATAVLPMNGATVYAELWSDINGTWQSSQSTFTEGVGGATPTPAALISPAAGSVLGLSTTFKWTAGAGVSTYVLWLGTTSGSKDLYNSGYTTATSATAAVPMNGATVYAELWSDINGTWQSTTSTFTEGAGGAAPTPAALISPATGSVLSFSTSFKWTAGTGVSTYVLWLGTTSGSNNLYNSGYLTATSATAVLPMNGATVYAELWSDINGTWQSTTSTFTEGTGGAMPTPAALTSPVAGSVLGASTTFTWSAGAGVSTYVLWLGTTSGSKDLYNSGYLTATSATATLPMNGVTVYAELWSDINGTWQSATYTFTEP
jgi:hypothetical protein